MPSYHLTCLCGAIQAPVQCSRASDFPFPTSLCHCNPCRLSTGALYTSLPRLIEGPSEDVLALCTHYASLGPKGIQRYFCSRCGTHVCLLDIRDGEWHGGGGAIESKDAGKVLDHIRVTGHIFANDPADGGIVGAHPKLVKLHYNDSHAQELPCFAEWKEGPPIPYGPLRALSDAASSMRDRQETDQLIAKCHCGGTDLRIRRANYAKDQQGVAERHIPAEKNKYLAYFCACRSCRLANGVSSLQPWSAIPPANISIASTGKAVAFGSATNEEGANDGTTLKHFWSSENVCWTFCSRCGALFFYWNREKTWVVDVAVGILQADEGSLARAWLSWNWSRIAFHEEVVDEQIYKAIVDESLQS